ncbi:MAG TPA: hypothetical protein DD738_10355 [Ruminiclostridium sp.]|nr:hypothetical protein [Ruminiclostridium sp.]
MYSDKKTLYRYKQISLLLIIFSLGLFFSSCSRILQNNKALNSLNIGAQEKGVLAVIKNMPDAEAVKKVPHLTTLRMDDSPESLLLIPVLNDSTVEIVQLSWDNTELKESGTVYKAENSEDGYGLYLKAIRPEGAPALKIIVTSGNERGEYILSYDGKDGTADMETIKAQ